MKYILASFFVAAAGVSGLGAAHSVTDDNSQKMSEVLVKYKTKIHRYMTAKTLDDSDEVEVEHLLQAGLRTNSYN